MILDNYGGKFKLFNDRGNQWVFALEENTEHRFMIMTSQADTNKYMMKISTDDSFVANYHDILQGFQKVLTPCYFLNEFMF